MSRKTIFPYAQLFESIPIGLYRRTPEGKLVDVNPALVTASGWPDRESLLALDNVKDLYAEADDLHQLHDLMARDGVVRQFETKLRRHHEPPLWVEINAVAVRDEQGQVVCYEGAITPIVERKQMELELRRSEQRLRAIMNALDRDVRAAVAEIAAKRKVEVGIQLIWRKPPTHFDAELVDAVENAARSLGYSNRRITSGAGHDACNLNSRIPTAMVFVPCKDGISHNELEDATQADCAAGANVLLHTMLALTGVAS